MEIQQAIEPHIPQIITGAANTFFTAFLLGGAYFIWWYIKRRIERKEAEEDERGPILHEVKHDEYCSEVAGEHIAKMDEVLVAVRNSVKEQKTGFKDVHKRIDDTNNIIVKHLEGELARKAV